MRQDTEGGEKVALLLLPSFFDVACTMGGVPAVDFGGVGTLGDTKRGIRKRGWGE